ncbi:MAG: TIGR03435 family protein, partial [Vicinamibacterales bacterium]
MAKLSVCFAGVLVLAFATLGAQGPQFEVASVKPNLSGDIGSRFGVRPGGQLVVTNNSLRNIVRNAWNLQDFQIIDGPDWFDRDRFDILAKPAVEPRSREEFAQMVQALLTERFKLRVHFETREIPIYALVLVLEGDTGPTLRPSAIDCATVEAAARRGGPPPTRPGERPLCGTQTTPGRMMAGGVTMESFARNLSNFAGR